MGPVASQATTWRLCLPSSRTSKWARLSDTLAWEGEPTARSALTLLLAAGPPNCCYLPLITSALDGASLRRVRTDNLRPPELPMLITSHQTKTVQEFVDLHKWKHLNLSPAFQRQSVWGQGDRQRLIQSLLDGIPLPAIYLYRRAGQGGVPKYDVIDGKQRIETILLFLGKGPLAKDSYLEVRTSFGDEAPDWWSWQDLDVALKNQVLTTQMPVIEVGGEDLSPIIDLFVRINSTGKRLTGQEKRHARYYKNPVLKTGQRLAEERKAFLLRHKVISASQAHRMKHVELLTELMLAMHAGQPLNKKRSIDDIMRGAPFEARHLAIAKQHVIRALNLVEAVLPDMKSTRFRNTTDFYSLALLLHTLREEGQSISAHNSIRNSVAAALLRDFARNVDEVNDQMRLGKGVLPHQQPFRDYLMTVRADTDSFKQRKTREVLLRDVLDGVFDTKDPTRLFTPTQRRIVWHATFQKVCGFCGKTIKRWEDMSVDHVRPHTKGGRTDLSNAQLSHRSCNSKAGAKWVP